MVKKAVVRRHNRFFMEFRQGLFAGEFFFEGCEGFEVAEGGLLDGGSSDGCFFLGLTGSAFCLAFYGLVCTCFIFKDAAVGKDDALGVLVELDNLEVELFVNLGLRAVFLDEVFGSGEAFNTVGESDNSALLEHLDDGAFVN